MIGWDEMIGAGVSPDKAVIMWWRHDRKHQLVKALENGYRVIMTPRRPLYADFIQYGGHKVGRVWGDLQHDRRHLPFPRTYHPSDTRL